jgi:hypothetical protein
VILTLSFMIDQLIRSGESSPDILLDGTPAFISFKVRPAQGLQSDLQPRLACDWILGSLLFQATPSVMF